MAGRPRLHGPREANGRISRATERAARKAQEKRILADVGGIPVGEAVRLRAAAIANVRDAVWGTVLGQLFIAKAIEADQFEAGKRWCNHHRLYAKAMESGSRDMKSPSFPIAVEDEAEARALMNQLKLERMDDETTTTLHVGAYTKALEALRAKGSLVERFTRALCEGNGQHLAGMEQMMLALQGLDALADHWKL